MSIKQEQVMVEGDCQPADYNYDQCIDSSLQHLLREELNCTVPWLSRYNDYICKVRVLTAEHLLIIFYF